MFRFESIRVKGAPLCFPIPGSGESPRSGHSCGRGTAWAPSCLSPLKSTNPCLPNTGLSSLLNAGEAEILEKLSFQSQRQRKN